MRETERLRQENEALVAALARTHAQLEEAVQVVNGMRYVAMAQQARQEDQDEKRSSRLSGEPPPPPAPSESSPMMSGTYL